MGAELTPTTVWKEYEFRAKLGPATRCPPIVATYHHRLDWLMWFLPFGVRVTSRGILQEGYDLWFIGFIEKILRNDEATMALLKKNPFPSGAPTYVRARFLLFRFTDWRDLVKTKAWWTREYLGDYLPPISLKQLNL